MNISESSDDDDDEEEFVWFVEVNLFIIQQWINHMAKWSDAKFHQTSNTIIAASSAFSVLIFFVVQSSISSFDIILPSTGLPNLFLDALILLCQTYSILMLHKNTVLIFAIRMIDTLYFCNFSFYTGLVVLAFNFISMFLHSNLFLACLSQCGHMIILEFCFFSKIKNLYTRKSV